MRKLNGLLAACAMLIVGCGFPSGSPGTSVPVGAPVSIIQAGAGTIISPGTQAGYGVTANVGASYRIVWTGDAAASGGYREFQGSVYTSGQFLTVVPGCAGNACPLEAGDSVSQPILIPGGERVDFDTTATTGIDGFDFTVNSEPAYFDLLIDGVRYPELVFFSDGTTGQLASAPGMPFGLSTH